MLFRSFESQEKYECGDRIMISGCNLEKAREQDPLPFSLFAVINVSTNAESQPQDSGGTALIRGCQRSWDM